MSLGSQFWILRKIHSIPTLRRNAQAKGKLISIIFGNKVDTLPFEINYRKGREMDASIFKSIKMAIYPLLLAAIFFTQDANAICTKNPIYPVVDFNMSGGPFIVKVDAKINDVIGVVRRDVVSPFGPRDMVMLCSGGGTARYSVRLGTPVPGFSNVYTTNIPGIGYKMLYTFEGNPNTSSRPDRARELPFSTTYSPRDPGVRLGNIQTFILEFIVISEISQGGMLFSGDVMTWTDDQGGVVMRAFLNANATRFIAPSCRVSGAPNKPIDVLFGRVAQSNFKGRGSVAAERNFNITLNCRAGIGVQSMVHLRMDATKDPAAVGDDGVLQITQGGVNTATGVGIQIVDGNSKAPVRFGDEAQVGASKDGDYVLPYTARYFQTGNRVTPGQANGTATFTVIYK
ncbi:type 1 fimbria pilin [Variovorax boronicumulans]|uniref:fimbrial protein n=1 Tax=Variovorax boronicumulans TaxID=436515 RepID=UPI00278206EF|nr:fimbrial protein [Variovorax boronicumulans]MDQ0073520.1 type 1 fimbria pilin [Variovorax boronicumulans]